MKKRKISFTGLKPVFRRPGRRRHLPQFFGAVSLLTATLSPDAARACACGCGVFDVGTSSMFPQRAGGMVFVDYDFQDQDHNWSGSSSAPAANNDDKEIRTHFVNFGLQYMFNSTWGMQLQVPYVDRYFKTTDDLGNLVARNWSGPGDVRIKGLYTGFSPDLATGVSFGFKLPTGDFKFDSGVVDRDTQIGSGSSDMLLGGFHRGNLGRNDMWDWFAQAELDVPVFTQQGYRPGIELDTAVGMDYKGWLVHGARISPVAQVIFSERTSDSGPNSASPVASGYQRVLLSPGIEINRHPVSLYADVELPVYEHVTGNQVVAAALFKLTVSYHF